MKKINRLTVIALVAMLVLGVLALTACGDGAGGGDNVPVVFNVATATQWKDAIASISGGGNNKSYVIEVSGTIIIPGSYYGKNTFGDADNLTITFKGSGTLKLNDACLIISIEQDVCHKIIIDGPTLEGYSDNSCSIIDIIGSGSSLELKNGKICNNISNDSGGGVYMNEGAVFTMSGGEISGTQGGNGAVSVQDDAKFIMTGGIISGNTADSSAGNGFGGGVYVQKAIFIKTGGVIYGNEGAVAAELRNQADSDTQGHAVFFMTWEGDDWEHTYEEFYRDITLGISDNLSTEDTGSGSGWGL